MLQRLYYTVPLILTKPSVIHEVRKFANILDSITKLYTKTTISKEIKRENLFRIILGFKMLLLLHRRI